MINNTSSYGFWFLAMFPVLAVIYIRLAKREERESIDRFREEYIKYVHSTPAFFPMLKRRLAGNAIHRVAVTLKESSPLKGGTG